MMTLDDVDDDEDFLETRWGDINTSFRGRRKTKTLMVSNVAYAFICASMLVDILDVVLIHILFMFFMFRIYASFKAFH